MPPKARSSHSAAEAEEQRVRGELEAARARLQQLYQKQGRSVVGGVTPDCGIRIIGLKGVKG